jgi:hypothetical protein
MHLASDRTPSVRLDTEELEHHQRKLQAEDQLRRGEQPDLLSFTRNERMEIRKNSRLTPLQSRAERLPMKDFLQVWDAATASEKAELSEEFIRKKNAYMKKSYNEGPEARTGDKVYRRLASMFQ